MSRFAAYFASSVPACSLSIVVGVGLTLSVANVDASDLGSILTRHAVGGVCLLAPVVAQRWRRP